MLLGMYKRSDKWRLNLPHYFIQILHTIIYSCVLYRYMEKINLVIFYHRDTKQFIVEATEVIEMIISFSINDPYFNNFNNKLWLYQLQFFFL